MLAIACGPEQSAIDHMNLGITLGDKGHYDEAISGGTMVAMSTDFTRICHAITR